MYKKLLKISLIVLPLLGIFAYSVVSLRYANKRLQHTLCTGLIASIMDSADNQFVKPEDIGAIFRTNKYEYFGKRMFEIPILDLENLLKSKSLIKDAQLYTTADGQLRANIWQRHPIVRIYTRDEQNFYIDNEGYIIQAYSAYTSFVPIVSGHINSPFARNFKGDMFQFFDKQKKEDAMIMNIFKLAKLLEQEPFWKAQIQQIYITQKGKVELIPRVGEHIICLGNFDNIAYKLQKLRTFYDKGIARKGWNAYTYIDLSYSNQVIAKLK
ncbi:MAG: cell division protein FtsQ/DivIB [Bacteroidales bacterium]